MQIIRENQTTVGTKHTSYDDKTLLIEFSVWGHISSDHLGKAIRIELYRMWNKHMGIVQEYMRMCAIRSNFML